MDSSRTVTLARGWSIGHGAKKRPGGVDRALGEPTHGGDGSVRGLSCTTRHYLKLLTIPQEKSYVNFCASVRAPREANAAR